MIQRRWLLTPGPTPVPDFVWTAMQRARGIHHRHPEFRAVWEDVTATLQALWHVDTPVILITGSGTAGMDALVSNLFAPGEKVIVGTIGKFGDRWVDIARQRGLQVVEVRRPLGYALHPEHIADTLRAHPDARGLLMQACETSTGVENPLAAIAPVVRAREVFWIVDAISGLGTMDIRIREWGIDGIVTASQKAWMLPPGLAMVALSARAWDKVRVTPHRPYYLDLLRLRAGQLESTGAFTPAIELVFGLQEVLKYIKHRGGLEALVDHCRQLAEMCRQFFTAHGWSLFAQEHPAAALTAVELPSELQSTDWLGYLKTQYGLWVAGGQGPLKGRIFRIAHMGYVDRVTLAGALEAIEAARQTLQSTTALP